MVLSIFASAIFYRLLGTFWFSPRAFGSTWLKLRNVRPQEMKEKFCGERKVVTYAGSFISELITAASVTALVAALHPVTWQETMAWGTLVALGIVAATQLPAALLAGKPMRLYLLESGFHVAGALGCFAVAAASRFYFIHH